jgi:heme A synthase
MSLPQIHSALANACLIFSLIIAGYGFLLYFRQRGIDSNYWGTLAAGELLFLAQGVLGVLLYASGLRAARTLVHALYGIVLVITLPGAYALTRSRDSRREALIYAILGLFLAGVTLRAMFTAAH